tara:strand:- start:1371 stop:1616 length:246 start_codon:yes stop_codon:yes gene_type:complete
MNTNIIFIKNKILYDTLIEIKESIPFKVEYIENHGKENLVIFDNQNLKYPLKIEQLIEKINILLLKKNMKISRILKFQNIL